MGHEDPQAIVTQLVQGQARLFGQMLHLLIDRCPELRGMILATAEQAIADVFRQRRDATRPKTFVDDIRESLEAQGKGGEAT